MSFLPRVTDSTREQVARQFDDLGPQACVQEIVAELRNDNPEILDMAEKCARDVGESARVMAGLCMFYGLLSAQSRAQSASEIDISTLPRVSEETRDLIVSEIDQSGPQAFTTQYIGQLERDNPELLQMAHNFASGQADYLRVMQGIALLWASLVAQLRVDRTRLH